MKIERWLGVWLVLALIVGCLACRPSHRLGDGPPQIDAGTRVLPMFDPAALAGPARTGLALDAALAGPPQPPTPAVPDPAVVDYGPTAEAGDYPTIQVRFNRPMVPLGEKQRVSASAAGFSITPAVAGEAYWAEPTRLVFEPRDPLPLATNFEVGFQRTLTAVDGPSLDVDLAWSFATAAPSLSMRARWTDRIESRDRYHWKTRIEVDATQKLALAELREHLTVTARTSATEDARPVEFTVRELRRDRNGYRAHDFEIRPKTRWPAGAEIVVQVDQNLRGEVGPRPLASRYVYSFDIVRGVRMTGVECVEGRHSDGCELGPVLVYFSAPISRAQAKHLHVSPKPRGLDVLAVHRAYPTDGVARDAYGAVMVWGDFRRGVDYELTVDDRLRDVHGQPLVGDGSDDFAFVEPPPSLELRQARGTFVEARGATLGIESRHVEQLGVRVAELDAEQIEALLDDPLERWPHGLRPTHTDTIAPTHTGKWGWSAHELDLRRYGSDRAAGLLIEVGADTLLARAHGRPAPTDRLALVQVTDIGLSAVSSLPRGVVRVARLADDAPVAGAEIELIAGPDDDRARRALGKTGTDGLLALPSSTKLARDGLLRATLGRDTVVVPAAQLWGGEEPDGPLQAGESARVALTSERSLYKPGEKVRAMGWAAIATPHQLSGLRELPPGTRVTIELFDHDGERVASRRVQAKAHGKFWATLAVPETAALGHYRLTATLLGTEASAGLRVEDFPVPEFEVAASASLTDIHGGETTRIRVDASYYFGGRVPITRARYVDECDEIDYRPPGLASGFAIAPHRDHHRGYGRIGYPAILLAIGPSAAAGHLEYDIEPRAKPVAQPLRCKHSVAVADATQREIGAEATVFVHPPFYLGARAPHSLDHGQDATIELRTLEFDGSPIAVDQVRVEIQRTWTEPEYVNQKFAGWRERQATLQPCKLATRADGAAQCSLAKLEHGDYTIRISAKQGDYAPTLERWLWVRAPQRSSWPKVSTSHLQVVVDRPKAKVGDALRARVQAPWPDGRGLIVLAKGGVHELRSFELDQGRAEIDYQVTDAWIPGAALHVLAVDPGAAGRLPDLRHAETRIDVDSGARELTVDLQIPAEARTRERLPISIAVRDAAGQPVAGHVSVWAVDEAVLSLAPFELPNFVTEFAVGMGSGLSLVDSYAALMLPYAARPDGYAPWVFDPKRDGATLYGYGYGSGAGAGGYGSGGGIGLGGRAGGASMPAARSRFDSAPIFIGDAKLDADGRAALAGELPDNLTTFRLMAVASSPLPGSSVEARFGTGDARVRVTRPLVVRAALPRILRPGDQAEIGVLVDNLRGGDGQIEVEVELVDAAGVLELRGPASAAGPLAAGEQRRFPFTIRARATGTVQLEVRATLTPATGEPVVDAVRLPLPVEPERTLSDRVAVYGSLDDDGAALLPFAIPADADPNFGGLSVSLGSTLLGGLEDAVDYLVTYPHGCLEQTASSLLPLVPLGRLAAQGYPLGIADVDAHVAHGIARLRTMQLPGGGFSYWPGGGDPAPYASAWATFVLTRAQAAGYAVPDRMLADAARYLGNIVDLWSNRAGPTLGDDIEIALILASLAERGAAPEPALAHAYARRERLPVFAQATLLIALDAQARLDDRVDPRVAELLGELRSVIDEREAVAKVETESHHTWYWDTDARSSAIVLIAMLRADPRHPLVSKLTRGLLDVRRGGRWSNTQENAWALLALADYAAIYEADAPDFDGRVWLANTMLASVHVEGRAYGFEDGLVPMQALLDAGVPTGGTGGPAHEDLILERAGQGRMYYRVGLEWASTASDLPAKAEGIRIARTLRDPSGIVGEDQAVDSGDLLAIDVELEVRSALDHVAIEIPLPAGIEAVNLELGKGGAAKKLSGSRGRWVSHQELRRDRAVLFADHLEPGVHRSTVFLHATTPGEYVMPAGQAEMMYYPEIYGRTTARRLVVR